MQRGALYHTVGQLAILPADSIGKKEPGMTFSSQIEALQAIVKRLESEPMPLEEAMSLFEEGMKKAAECRIFLEQARQKVTLLAEEDGDSVEKPWDPLEGGES